MPSAEGVDARHAPVLVSVGSARGVRRRSPSAPSPRRASVPARDGRWRSGTGSGGSPPPRRRTPAAPRSAHPSESRSPAARCRRPQARRRRLRSARPTIDGSDAKRRCQSPWPSTTRRAGRGSLPRRNGAPRSRGRRRASGRNRRRRRSPGRSRVRPCRPGWPSTTRTRRRARKVQGPASTSRNSAGENAPRRSRSSGRPWKRARDSIGVAHRERPQLRRVDDREDGGVGADPERERADDGDGAHGRALRAMLRSDESRVRW